MILDLVISGGQTGADQAGWRAAKAAGIPTGGAMPKGFLTEEGSRPEFAKEFNAHDLARADYPARTRENVGRAHGTLWIGYSNTPGGRLTAKICREMGKPLCLIAKADGFLTAKEVADWILDNQLRIINVAGNRESKFPGIGAAVQIFLGKVFEILKEQTGVV